MYNDVWGCAEILPKFIYIHYYKVDSSSFIASENLLTLVWKFRYDTTLNFNNAALMHIKVITIQFALI